MGGAVLLEMPELRARPATLTLPAKFLSVRRGYLAVPRALARRALGASVGQCQQSQQEK